MQSRVNFNATLGNRIWTIYTNQLTMFHDRFNGEGPNKLLLQVLQINDKEYCKVEFRDTPDTTKDNNLLSKLLFSFSSPNIDRQVGHLFKLISKTDWKN